jgi:sec-independent protein translocase protein TatB
MEFLGIGPLELVFVLIIALIVIGPRDMAKTARTAGRFLNRLYKSEGWRTFLEASRSLRGLPNRLAREAEREEFKELRELKKEMTQAGQALTKDLKTMENEVKASITPPAQSGSAAAVPTHAPVQESGSGTEAPKD